MTQNKTFAMITLLFAACLISTYAAISTGQQKFLSKSSDDDLDRKINMQFGFLAKKGEVSNQQIISAIDTYISVPELISQERLDEIKSFIFHYNDEQPDFTIKQFRGLISDTFDEFTDFEEILTNLFA